MSRDGLKPGAVIIYPYLWRWQDERGETEGRKDRPVSVVLAKQNPKDGATHLVMLAISSQPPRPGRETIEVPEIECRRAGLSAWKQAWITVSEYNYDIVERSYYLEPDQVPLGRFSRPFMMRLSAAFAPFFRMKRSRVDRVD
jgi:hypothetical protein